MKVLAMCLIRDLRRPVCLLMLVVVLTVAGVGLLANNIAQIRAALPADTLYGERDLSTLMYDMTRLELALQRASLIDRSLGQAELRFVADVVRIRAIDRVEGLHDVAELGGQMFASQLLSALDALDNSLRNQLPPPQVLAHHRDQMADLRQTLRNLNDAVFQTAMAQTTAQRTALTRLQTGTTIIIALLGSFGLWLITLLKQHQHAMRNQEAAEREIRRLAFFDPLTGLANRRMLTERLRQALTNHAGEKRHGALIFIDLDNFKTLNDTRGHQHGDRLLRQVAQRLQSCVRDSDAVARIGGDEFVIMMEDIGSSAADAARYAESAGYKILHALNEAYQLGGDETHSTPSIGIALFDTASDDIDEVLKCADLAMYQAKEAGRNTLRFFDPAILTRVSEQSALEVELRRALKDRQFSLHFQPQFDRLGRIVGAEALLRWFHPERGMVSPADFIPVAERSGLILPIGRWVMANACEQLSAWQRDPATRGITLAVNVSARQFRHPDFVAEVEQVMRDYDTPPELLQIELTESLLLDDMEEAIGRMQRLRSLGVEFALDDFGTGYSSLSYLKRLPLSQLKIDRSFVRDVLTDPNDAAITRTIIALGRSLGLEVLAEGVETAEQHRFLMEQGCDVFQGYLLARPQRTLPQHPPQATEIRAVTASVLS